MGAEEGMPQLNPEFWPAQIFWLLIIFLSLYIISWKIFLPKIANTIENRKLKIISDLNEAQKLKVNAEKKHSEYNKIIENSKKEAKKILEDSQKKLTKDIEEKKIKFENEIDKELSSVEKEIRSLKKSSVSDINKIAEELTSEILKELVNTEVNKSNITAVIGDLTKKKFEKYI